jgi:hypothetical protein
MAHFLRKRKIFERIRFLVEELRMICIFAEFENDK